MSATAPGVLSARLVQWEYLPQELGSGMTCRRHLAAWIEASVWEQLHALLLKQWQEWSMSWAGRAATVTPAASPRR